MDEPWAHEAGTDILMDVLVVPKASRTRIVGIHDERLRIQISAAPSDNQANEALIKFLAKALDISKSRVEIVSGATARRKTVRVHAMRQMQVVLKLKPKTV